MEKDTLGMLAYILVIIGGINWGLIGLFRFDLVDMIFGAWPGLIKVIYIFVGLSALYMIFTCNKCTSSKSKKR